MPVALANALSLARAAPDAVRFRRALALPEETQRVLLRRMLRAHSASEYGQAHGFAGIGDAAAFARRVPLSDHSMLAPWIERAKRGERDVLARGAVTHLAPTSGSTGAQKLIPFTAGLQRSFARAVNAWLVDLARQRPSVAGGPAYWSVSPSLPDEPVPPGEVRVGFDDDAEYLSGGTAWLVRQAMAVPSAVRHVRDENAFWRLTLLALLRRQDLRLVSVWHPSFLELLVAAALPAWEELLDAVRSGACPWSAHLRPEDHDAWKARPDPRRSDELHRTGPEDWPRWWPRLQVVSCWGDQAAFAGFARLRRTLPHALVQAKGLLATEAVVTIPVAGHFPLAVTSHYFEFIDGGGNLRHSHELERGAQYEVVVSNGGGLWRYRLGDLVECTGHLACTPTLRFLGRAGVVSDLRGEKLSDAFVAETMRALWDSAAPAVSELHAWEDDGRAGYTLRISDEVSTNDTSVIARRCEDLLTANPHYAVARRLGQLAPLRVTIVARAEHAAELRSRPGRLGDAKPRSLVRT